MPSNADSKNDYTAWPHLIVRKNLFAFSVGHCERTHLKQFCAVWFLPDRWFHADVLGRLGLGHVVVGIYDNAAAEAAGIAEG